MRPPMNFRKHVEEPNCLDRISSLPDELLARVLSFLPTRLAVRTSILSTRWRYLFTLTTCLSFDDGPCFDHQEHNEIRESIQRFTDFVDNVLELHQISPIKKFTLVCIAIRGASVFNRWFSNVLQKGVQEVNYMFPFYKDCEPDFDGFFTSQTLVNLKIKDFGRLKKTIPLTASLPKLKILHLESFLFSDLASMERLFSSCKLLEELTLICCICESTGHAIYRTGMLKVLTIEDCRFRSCTLEIDAPNLAYLTYLSSSGVKIVPSWKHSCSFVRAELVFKCFDVDVDVDVDVDNQEESAMYERELLKAAAYKATKIRFKKHAVQVLLPQYGGEQMPDFYILSSLQLANCPYDTWQYVTTLIHKSPRLETVIFGKGFPCCRCSNVNCPDDCYCNSPSPSEIPLNPFSCHVQVIEVRNFCAHMGSLPLMGHLLRNANVLKRLTVNTISNRHSYDEMEVCKEQLLMLPRASSDCCVDMN